MQTPTQNGRFEAARSTMWPNAGTGVYVGDAAPMHTGAHLPHFLLVYKILSPLYSTNKFSIKRSHCSFLPARPYLARVLAVVCIRPSQVSVLLKRLNVGSRKQQHTIAQGV